MSRVIFMCGPAGSGKSTYAQRFEGEAFHLAIDRETVLNRVRARRGSHPDDFVLTEELAAQYFDHFEPPAPDEGPLTVIRE